MLALHIPIAVITFFAHNMAVMKQSTYLVKTNSSFIAMVSTYIKCVTVGKASDSVMPLT